MSLPTFVIPDFISRCPFPLEYHPNGDTIATESDDWYRNGFDTFSDVASKKLTMLMAGKLSAYVYNDSDDYHLRTSCDLMQLIFHYGDLTDDLGQKENKTAADLMMNALWFPRKFQPIRSRPDSVEPTFFLFSFWLRCVRDAPLGFQRRFLENIGLFLEARHVQSKHRGENVVPTLEEYIDVRRDSSGLKPLIDFLEYTLGVDIPDEAMEHPVMEFLKQNVNDFCTWTNVRFMVSSLPQAYMLITENKNMVIIFMKQNDMDLQQAIDVVGEMCFEALENFQSHKRKIPSWGKSVDEQVARYIKGLENWLIACLHWSYMSGRYFGTSGLKIKETRIVKLLPKKI